MALVGDAKAMFWRFGLDLAGLGSDGAHTGLHAGDSRNLSNWNNHLAHQSSAQTRLT